MFNSKFTIGAIACLTIAVTSCTKTDLQTEIKENNVLAFNPMGGAVPTSASDYAKIPVLKLSAADEASARAATSITLPMPPVANQGSDASCVAFATAYAARSSAYAKTTGNTSFDFASGVFSPAYVYNQTKMGSCAGGSSVYMALSLMYNQGVCTYASMPYVVGGCDVQPSGSQTAQAANYKISGFATVSNRLSTLKSTVAAGKPLIVCGPVNSQFTGYQAGTVIGTYNGTSNFYHAYIVIGYDDAKQAFKIQNSWGTGWGENGYAWISYTAAAGWWPEIYAIN